MVVKFTANTGQHCQHAANIGNYNNKTWDLFTETLQIIIDTIHRDIIMMIVYSNIMFLNNHLPSLKRKGSWQDQDK